MLADGAVLPAFGILGGGSAVPVASYVVRQGRDLHFDTPGKVSGFRMKEGDVLVLQSAGGGGYGDPLERDPERVRADVRAGYVSAERARERYGVVLGTDGGVDAALTAALRRTLLAGRFVLTVVDVGRALYEPGAVSKRRVCPLNGADAGRAGLSAGDIVELIGVRSVLRAWVALDGSVGAGTVPLDQLARGVLDLAAGARLQIRTL